MLEILAIGGGTRPAIQSDRGGQAMALANLMAYMVVFGLPIWLVAEEIVHRFGSVRRAEAVAPAGLERRSPDGVRARASFV